ncbi:MAG: DUF420 domain-containing protein [Flavobacteriales bacterium]|jgi:putative membrane protein|nr:DUF420 domain-containing protein [Flavobacteriales bacterium]
MDYKKLKKIIWIFSALVFALVVALRYLPKPEVVPSFTHVQPFLHALINGTCFLLLIGALFAVKAKNIDLHRKLITIAMIMSLVFLLSYVLYHAFAPETKYLGEYKGLYLVILATHIVLAALSLPFILLAFAKAFTGMIEEHKKMVKWVFPIWLYVTLTGVLVYLFLSPYYVH